ncbi:hypothetical protein [Trebonia sp.]|uniref:hypothetical protein n=1 Tax=Trebonia sp. TaxID=2767075 RepID=UPI002612CF09|nr:hypothetical protein [Trebonia sp.]
MLSLSERERRILSRVADELHRTAPTLVSLLSMFNRLALGEDMPRRRPLRHLRRQLSRPVLARAFVSVWTATTLAMIALALILSHVSHGTSASGGCGRSWSAICDARAAGPPAQ